MSTGSIGRPRGRGSASTRYHGRTTGVTNGRVRARWGVDRDELMGQVPRYLEDFVSAVEEARALASPWVGCDRGLVTRPSGGV